jgi:hypothetical protein
MPLNLNAVNSADVLAVVIKCVDFAAVKHKYQRRKDPEKTPYINHPIGNKIVEVCVIINGFENTFCYLFEIWFSNRVTGKMQRLGLILHHAAVFVPLG